MGIFAPINGSNQDWLLTFPSFGSTVGEISDQPAGKLSVPICHVLAHREEAKIREGTHLGIFVVITVSWADKPFQKDVGGSTDSGAMNQAPSPKCRTCFSQKGGFGLKRSRSGTGMMAAFELTDGRWMV